MNRSLEALAIFTICLGGILAVVRFSAQDRSADRRVATQGEQVQPATPPKNCCSEDEQIAPDGCAASYAEGCGLDRNEGTVYSPWSPLLSPREVALRAIRSEPIPLVILPEANEAELQTGYDAAYDAAMTDPPAAEEQLSRAEIEAEYAAAELAAASVGDAEGTFSELTPPSPAWSLLTRSVTGAKSQFSEATAWVQRSYVDPFSRGFAHRWSQSDLRLLIHPRAKVEARQQLLHRKRAQNSKQVSWDDYLAFVDRRLVKKPTSEEREAHVARQKNVLWPR
jgi:hypothetical protein